MPERPISSCMSSAARRATMLSGGRAPTEPALSSDPEPGHRESQATGAAINANVGAGSQYQGRPLR